MIFYFSGTGNSRYVAKRIAEASGDEAVSINDRIKNQDPGKIKTGANLIFAVPTYAWRIPKIVEQWIKDTEFIGAERAWFVMTCGDENGNAGKYLQRLCQEKQWQYMGTVQIEMPENYIAMFAVPKPSTAEKIIRNAETDIDAAAKKVAAGQAFPAEKVSALDRIKSSLINPAFYAMFVKDNAFQTTDACIGCGKCASLCPMNNIQITAGKPVWNGHCTHCMACISYCPAEAIEYGKKSSGKPRYHCDL